MNRDPNKPLSQEDRDALIDHPDYKVKLLDGKIIGGFRLQGRLLPFPSIVGTIPGVCSVSRQVNWPQAAHLADTGNPLTLD